MTSVTVNDFIYSYISGNVQTNGDILLVDGVGSNDIYVGTDNGRYIITYSHLQSGSDVNTIGYYGPPNGEYSLRFAGATGSNISYNANIRDTFSNIFVNYDPYDNTRMLFQDVARIDFSEISNISSSNYGMITIGQADDTLSLYVTIDENGNPVAAPAVSIGYSAVEDINRTSDIIINAESGGNGSNWSNLDEGGQAYKTILEEITHSLGADVYRPENREDSLQAFDPATNPLKPEFSLFDNQKYTVTSYAFAREFTGVSPHGLQLLDIATLQSLYGRNYDKAGTSATNWDLSSMHYSTDFNDAFLFTIWDGGGLNDTIDVSAIDNYYFLSNVEIDLRQGRFSSIGDNVSGTPVANYLTLRMILIPVMLELRIIRLLKMRLALNMPIRLLETHGITSLKGEVETIHYMVGEKLMIKILSFWEQKIPTMQVNILTLNGHGVFPIKGMRVT